MLTPPLACHSDTERSVWASVYATHWANRTSTRYPFLNEDFTIDDAIKDANKAVLSLRAHIAAGQPDWDGR